MNIPIKVGIDQTVRLIASAQQSTVQEKGSSSHWSWPISNPKGRVTPEVDMDTG